MKKKWQFPAVALLIAVGAAFSVLSSSADETDKQLRTTVDLLSSARVSVGGYMRDKTEVPQTIDDTGLKPILPAHVSKLEIRSGAIVAVFGQSATSALKGRELITSPKIGSDGLFSWACGSATIEQSYLPENCRATDLSTNIAIQLEQRRNAVIASKEAERRQNAFKSVYSQYASLDPNDSRYDPGLHAVMERRVHELSQQGQKDYASVIPIAAREVMQAHYEEQVRVSEEQGRKVATKAAQRDRQEAERLNRLREVELKTANDQMVNRQVALRNSCRFLYFINNDPSGVDLAYHARQECINNEGRQGPAYMRWKAHRDSETARRRSVAPTYTSKRTTNSDCLSTGYDSVSCTSTSRTVSEPDWQPDLASASN